MKKKIILFGYGGPYVSGDILQGKTNNNQFFIYGLFLAIGFGGGGGGGLQ